jgi:hypothetical protein
MMQVCLECYLGISIISLYQVTDLLILHPHPLKLLPWPHLTHSLHSSHTRLFPPLNMLCPSFYYVMFCENVSALANKYTECSLK